MKKMIFLLLFAVVAIAGCTTSQCPKNPNNKDVVCALDIGPQKDTKPASDNDLGEYVQNPNAWKDGQECLDWTKIQPSSLIFGMSGGCNCWKPPYCWCPSPGGSITAACTADKEICCNFMSTCLPCGWEAMTRQERDSRNWSLDGNSQKCKELLTKFGILGNADFRVCHKWK